jgi:hypothetical protein
MRPTYGMPLDNGSRRSQQCPPSHPLMALPSHPAQASMRLARPSGPSTHAALMEIVSPLLHQQGSTTPSACDLPSTQASPPDHLAKGLMAPFPATTEAAMPSPSLARPFLLTRSSPTHPLPMMGGSAALASCRVLARTRSHQHLAFAMSQYPGFADEHPWVMENINAVARELQCWYQQHSIH